ncbi:MAG: hypothetical protein AAF657_25435, partial [Acidobacteriota bacterium]
WLDECEDPKSSGALGFRKIPNPKYKPKLWDAEKYAHNSLIEPPFRIGLTCGVCHLGFSPTNPPEDPRNPAWDNVDSMVGNQYLNETIFYSGAVTEEDFEWHILKSQARGTSDPTRLANDLVNNPNAIRAVTHVKGRQRFAEERNDGTVEDTLHLFIDGSDFSVKTAGLRVYLNIGLCFKYWVTRHIPLVNGTPQKVFDFDKAAEVCDEWSVANDHAEKLATFLESQNPDYHLASAPGGAAYLTDDQEVLKRGKIVFAENCAWCHSSKQPPMDDYNDYDPETAIPWFREAVMQDDFLDDNLLGDERRYPAIEIGANLARAMNNNSARGHIYDQFSTATYKNQPSGGSTEFYNPYDPDNPIPFEFPPGQGYYKPFPLYGVWAFAPFLHNNSVGKYTGDPSVEGRMAAFDDAVEKLLWPEKRDGIDAIYRTSVDSKPVLPGRRWLDVPAGTPTVLLANVDWVKLNLDKETIMARLEGGNFEDVVPLLLEHNIVPDFIPDRGHEYGAELPDEDKRALIEYMKTM